SVGVGIVYEARHIINTEHDPRETPNSRYARRCFETRRVIDEGKAVGYLYSEAPEDENDSGWRLMAGDETDDYMNTAGT
ncbi:immunity protein Imm33 domain-containing protein, partial [Pseudomonas aeruginosa]|uniref:immunity protein Imm33 domain-containing protein n=1 Tax=Pseudomonas aeruginosa TaxID=287 RepID=UPI003CC69543